MNNRIVHRAKTDNAGALVLDDSPALRFPWWSVTKTVLAACVLRLVARGRLTLDATVAGRAYTLRQLLQHRAGVRNYGGLAAYHAAVARNDDPWTADDLLKRLDADRLDFAPDQGWAYSNTGYLVLRRIVEETTGADIGTAMRRLVFDPLDLHAVSLAAEPGDLEATAWGNRDRYHPGWVYHGLLVGTAGDAVRFSAVGSYATSWLSSQSSASRLRTRSAKTR